jgi:hypothetical protein
MSAKIVADEVVHQVDRRNVDMLFVRGDGVILVSSRRLVIGVRSVGCVLIRRRSRLHNNDTRKATGSSYACVHILPITMAKRSAIGSHLEEDFHVSVSRRVEVSPTHSLFWWKM